MFEACIEIVKACLEFSFRSVLLFYSSVPGLLSFVVTSLGLFILFRYVGLPIVGGSGFTDVTKDIRASEKRKKDGD